MMQKEAKGAQMESRSCSPQAPCVGLVSDGCLRPSQCQGCQGASSCCDCSPTRSSVWSDLAQGWEGHLPERLHWLQQQSSVGPWAAAPQAGAARAWLWMESAGDDLGMGMSVRASPHGVRSWFLWKPPSLPFIALPAAAGCCLLSALSTGCGEKHQEQSGDHVDAQGVQSLKFWEEGSDCRLTLQCL